VNDGFLPQGALSRLVEAATDSSGRPARRLESPAPRLHLLGGPVAGAADTVAFEPVGVLIALSACSPNGSGSDVATPPGAVGAAPATAPASAAEPRTESAVRAAATEEIDCLRILARRSGQRLAITPQAMRAPESPVLRLSASGPGLPPVW
jgi:hypothetical protein